MPDAIAGPLAAAAALLAVAGVQKLRRPEATIDAVRALGLDAPPVSARLLGVVELAVGAGCLAFPSVVALDAALQSNDEIRGCCVVGPGDEGDVPTVETQKKPD